VRHAGCCQDDDVDDDSARPVTGSKERQTDGGGRLTRHPAGELTDDPAAWHHKPAAPSGTWYRPASQGAGLSAAEHSERASELSARRRHEC